jgi:hypothetical protein
MSDRTEIPVRSTERRSPRWPIWGALATVAFAFLAVPSLAGVPARVIEGCAKWIGLAGALELLSVLGFVVVFKLVFGARMTWRQGAPAGLRAIGATTVLPVGGFVGPAVGAGSTDTEGASLSELTRSSATFLVLTNAPGVIVLAALGPMLWAGWAERPARGDPDAASGRRSAGGSCRRRSYAARLAGLVEGAELQAAWRGNLPAARRARRGLRNGVADARDLLMGGNWKLLGALGYYAFDNAVLWASFQAYGRTPSVAVIVMGYLVGSLAAALPIPAGLGAVEGGLFSALVLYGAPAAPTAAAVLLYRGISLALPLLLGAVAWTSASAGSARPWRSNLVASRASVREPSIRPRSRRATS